MCKVMPLVLRYGEEFVCCYQAIVNDDRSTDYNLPRLCNFPDLNFLDCIND